MRNAKIPTIIGILVLVIGVVVGVYLVQSRQIFRLKASPEVAPRNVQKTNVTDSSFTVSWTTDKSTEGFIKWGENPSNLDKTATVSPIQASSVHAITIYNLSENSAYYFNISSDGVEFDNEGIPWEIKTGKKLTDTPNSVVISGKIISQSGSPASGVLVYTSIGEGVPLSTTTNENGDWVIAISSTRNQSLDAYMEIDEASTQVQISVQTANQGLTSAKIYPQSAKPAPEMTLGEVYDFTNLPPSKNLDMPESSIELPDTATKSSGFVSTDSVDTEAVTLDAIKEGEIITTQEPEFFGGGPPGEKIIITVESDPQTANISVNTSGFWNWTPPENLEEGIHKITISWRNAQGVLQTITRSFVVSAQEGPAFTATPSASPSPTIRVLTQTPTPTPTKTITPTPTTTGVTTTPILTPTATKAPTKTLTPTKVATTSAIPDAGFSTPTILLIILGFSLIIFGAGIYLLPNKK